MTKKLIASVFIALSFAAAAAPTPAHAHQPLLPGAMSLSLVIDLPP